MLAGGSIMKIFCSQSRPGKRGFPLSISAKTHPILQMSIARVYSLKVNMTSGARYQRVATYSVMKVDASLEGLADWREDLAKPKSQTCTCVQRLTDFCDQDQCTFKSQFAFSKRLEGLRSRCRTLAECIALRARRACKRGYIRSE